MPPDVRSKLEQPAERKRLSVYAERAARSMR